jgi:uncharacterized membrane protein
MGLDRLIFWVGWNILLALIPVVLAIVIYRLDKRPGGLPKKLGMVVLGLVWFAFLPNTCYLLTEWRHFLASVDGAGMYLRTNLDSVQTLHLMFRTAFYFVFSGTGMIAFALAIRPMAALARSRSAHWWTLGIPLFVTLSLGIYLGLILRYNSWDLLMRPAEVFASIGALSERPRLSVFIVAFGGFLWLAYFVLDVWIDGLIARWRKVFGSPKASS